MNRMAVFNFSALALLFATSDATSADSHPVKPPAAAVQPFSESLYGVTVSDPYRYMESMDAATVDWMKAQGAYTRSILDSIPARASFAKRMIEFTSAFSALSASDSGAPYQQYGARLFFLEREPGSDNADLFVKEAGITRKLFDVAKLRAANGGKPFAINYFQASPQGVKVAIGISEGGSEDSSLYVYDVKNGADIAGPVDRARYGGVSWLDEKSLFITRFPAPKPGDSPLDKFLNTSAQIWNLSSEPRAIVGASAGNAKQLNLEPSQIPFVQLFPGGTVAVFENVNGTQNEMELWIKAVELAADVNAAWKPLATRADNVTGIEVRGDEIFLLSHQEAPTFKVLALHANQKLADAKTIVPPRSDRVIESIHAAADGLYVLTREGIYSHLLRVSVNKRAVQEIPLPLKGYLSAAFSDPSKPGIVLTLESWVVPPTEYKYDAASGKFTDLKLETRPAYDPAQFKVQDLHATARDGVEIPLTVMGLKDAQGPQVVLLDAYGAYGISILPQFSARYVALMREGATYAVCHVRGGGEHGEAWRLGGKDATKPNTWRDLVDCAENLIARGLTTKAQLCIIGGSAGGITMGRALTERPDLFAGVIDQVPVANPLRFEFTPNGRHNVVEFGSIASEQGFKNLLAMDSYHAVKMGVQYPAVLITTGLNDIRVAPWQPAKFAARLQASGAANPVLLRVESDAGHGIGSAKSQKDEEFADRVSFVFWRAGRPAWQPEQ